MALIPNFFLDTVVAIGVKNQQGKKTWVGTGFLVGRKERENPAESTVYLITNKHVIETREKIFVKFNSKGQTTTKDYEIDLFDNSNNPMFSKHDTADIIAKQIIPKVLIEDESVFAFFDLDDHALTLSQMNQTGVTEGTLVYALGFPMKLVDSIKKSPICRLGCISRISNLFADGDDVDYLVDAQVFPGNSGGPVISRPEHFSFENAPYNVKANLIGILHSYIPYQDVLISLQTSEQRSVIVENSGLTRVYPVDMIKEIVEIEWQRNVSTRLT